MNLENVTHEDAVATLKATQDRVTLIIAKTQSAFNPPPTSEPSYSPQLCKHCIFTISNTNLYDAAVSNAQVFSVTKLVDVLISLDK